MSEAVIGIVLAVLAVVLIVMGVSLQQGQKTKPVGQVAADLGIALGAGFVVGLAIFLATDRAEERRASRAEAFQREMVRRQQRIGEAGLVRSIASSGDVSARKFAQVDLRGQLLNQLDLAGAIFNEALLTEATLYLAQLGGADLKDADLQCTRMYDANFESAAADLRRAKFQGADMRHVKFGEANLAGAQFGRPDGYADVADVTDLRGADLSKVQGIGSVDWGDGVIYNDEDDELSEDEIKAGRTVTKWPGGVAPQEVLKVEPPDPQRRGQGARCRPFKYRVTDEETTSS